MLYDMYAAKCDECEALRELEKASKERLAKATEIHKKVEKMLDEVEKERKVAEESRMAAEESLRTAMEKVAEVQEKVAEAQEHHKAVVVLIQKHQDSTKASEKNDDNPNPPKRPRQE